MEYNEYGTVKRKKLSVGMGLFLTCIILTTLVGLFAGLLISNYTHDNYLMKQQAEVPAAAQTPVAESRETVKKEADATPAPIVVNVPALAESGMYTRAQIVEKCAPAVVGIDITYTATMPSGMYGFGFGYGYGGGSGGTQEAKASGSGVILTPDGYIATCAHVVDTANTINVTLNDDTQYPATLIGVDSRNDIAIIKIDAKDLIAAEVGDSDMLTVGEDVIAIGNPLGELRGTATSGIISATRRTIEVESVELELIQTDTAINSGNSGGGLFNANGQLIGIVNAKVSSSGVEGLGFAIPVNNVAKEINDLVSYGYVTGRAYLGVYTQNVTLRSDYGIWSYSNGTSCVQVADVVKDSAADRAGLKTGDLILKVDDKTVTSNTVLSDLIAGYNAGDTATLTIQRSGSQMTIDVTFGEYKPESSDK